ncbi:MAG: ECF transporter S component [Lachnospiraceae bacterium]|nr:ECF transporter S component [Lachnospiraceae bacterium]
MRCLSSTMTRVSKTKFITICGMFGALAGLLMLAEFSVPIAPGFYKLDFSEVPVLVGGMYLGPVGAVVIEIVKILLKLVIKGTSTAFVGDFANFAVGCSLVLPAVIVYHTKKNRKRALVGLLVGTVTITVFGTLFNAWYLLPAFSKLYGMPLDVIISMGTAINPKITNVMTFVVFAVGPLNLIKGLMVSLVTMLIYKHISKILHGMMN